MRTSEQRLRFGDKIRGKTEIVRTCAEKGVDLLNKAARQEKKRKTIKDEVKKDMKRVVSIRWEKGRRSTVVTCNSSSLKEQERTEDVYNLLSCQTENILS